MIYRSIFLFFFLLVQSYGFAQELNARVLDSLTQNPIPFASIYMKTGNGVVSNEEGSFGMRFASPEIAEDTLFISCMGYETLKLYIPAIQDSIFYLSPKAIALNSVVLSNKEIEVSQLLKEIQKDIPKKYELGHTQKKLFFREFGTQEFKKMDLKVKKTSIKEFNQDFWDETLQNLPKKNEWYSEFVGTLYGNFDKEKQKLKLEKAVDIEDKNTTAIFKNMERLIDTVLQENIKEDSYFKIRSGILGGKIDSENLSFSLKDTLSKEEKEVKKKSDFLSLKKRILSNLIQNLFKDEELNFNILNKTSKYHFELVDYTYRGETAVYVLEFEPKSNEDFKGKLYIDADRMTLIRLEYKNFRNIRDFSMFGVSFQENLKEVIIQFKKTVHEKYAIEYLEYSHGYNGGFDRPLVLTEKNKVVKGRNKQNQLKLDLNAQNSQFIKYQIVVFETLPITEDEFNSIKEIPSVLPTLLSEYDSTFWEGYSIIEPDATLKEFKIIPQN